MAIQQPWQPAPDVPDHKDADKIRQQVDYYFSDDNIYTDRFLLEKIGGTRNLPINITRIMSFKKMKEFRPKTQVMKALMTAKNIVCVDASHIQRKVPIVFKGYGDGDDGVWTDADKPKPLRPTPPPTSGSISLKKVTGFEDDFADAPTTPAEAEEDKGLYSSCRPFHDRIEFAIERFKSRRKFHSKHLNFFNSWLKFGGIEACERSFTGRLGPEDLQDMDTNEILMVKATHTAGHDKMDETQWVVDFEGLAKAYLSSEFPERFFDYAAEDAKLQCRIMDSFYRYILTHDVCPEYETEIFAAQGICETANRELSALSSMAKEWPGAFNKSCSVLLGGQWSSIIVGNSWADDEELSKPTLTLEGTRVVVLTALMALGSDEMINALEEMSVTSKANVLQITEVRSLGLEVVEIQPPAAETLEFYLEQQNNTSSKNLDLKPVGKLVCKRWNIPTFAGSDVPKLSKQRYAINETFTFWLEVDLLKDCFVGMKLDTTIHRVGVKGCSDGIWTLDRTMNSYCSFHNHILNELMPKPYKDPRWLTQEELEEEQNFENSGEDGDNSHSD